MNSNSLKDKVDFIVESLGNNNQTIVKEFYINNSVKPIEGALVYIESLVDEKLVDEYLLTPLMDRTKTNHIVQKFTAEYINKRYICMSNTKIESDISKVIGKVQRGFTVIIINNCDDFILANTIGGVFRGITEPISEASVSGAKEGFVENIQTNIDLIKRSIKDDKLKIEAMTVGKRSETDIALVYLSDVANPKLISNVKEEINNMDVDTIIGSGQFAQLFNIRDFCVLPQIYITERVDTVKSDITQGRVAMIIEGSPHVCTAPSQFSDFFQGVDDYNQPAVISSFIRILRLIATLIITTLPALYLTLITYNAQLIPLELLTPIVQSRQGIALSPFIELLLMEIIVEFIREGGLRLPFKVGQTLSVVAGIIIGEAALQAQIVSPSTILIVGITTVSTFLIPNYDMSSALRIIKFMMLFVANYLGFFGIIAFSFYLITMICSLETFGFPYLRFKFSDMKDIFIRAPMRYMKKRPESIFNRNPIRQDKSNQ